MTGRHLDEGTLQAYIDGELTREHAASTAAHLAACESCSAAVASAENETSFFAAAFAPDETIGVPTAALRARLNAAVAQLEAAQESEPRRAQGRSFRGFLATLSGAFNFTPRALAACATLFVALVAGVIYFSLQRSESSPARTNEGQQLANNRQPSESAHTPEGPLETPTPVTSPERPIIQVVNHKQKAPGRGVVKQQELKSPTPKPEALPGEKAYQTAIASLEKSIKFGGEQTLRPAVRADYERNLALLDNAIQRTRQVAAQNPKDKDAVGFLMAAYQSKVELLTRVADQAQVAALGR